MNWRLPRLAIRLENQTGILSLVGFPTIQLAEEYFESLFGLMDHDSKSQLYFKKSGPMLAILEGDFAPRTADRLLSTIEFSYSVKWIYDAKNRGSGRNVGGIRRSHEYGSPVPGSDRITGRVFTVRRSVVRYAKTSSARLRSQ